MHSQWVFNINTTNMMEKLLLLKHNKIGHDLALLETLVNFNS